MISEHDISRAWRLLALPTIAAFFLLVWLNRGVGDVPWWGVWAVQIVLFITLAFIGVRQFGDDGRVYLINVLAGFCFAFAVVVVGLFTDFSFSNIFALVTEPVYAAVAALGVGWVVCAIERSSFRLAALLDQGRKVLRWKG